MQTGRARLAADFRGDRLKGDFILSFPLRPPHALAPPARILAALVALALLLAILYVLPAPGETVLALIAGALGLAGLLLATRFPVLGLGAIAVVVAAEVSQNLTASFGVPPMGELIAPALALVLGLRFLVHGDRPFVSGAVLLALGLWLLWAFGGLLRAPYWQVTMQASYGLAKDFVLVGLTLAFIDRPERLRSYLSALIATYVVICLAGFYRYVTLDPGNFAGFANIAFVERRFTGPFPDANFFASFLALLIPVCLGRVLAPEGWRERGFALVAAGVLTGGLILTASRGGLLGVVAVLPIFMAFLDRRNRRRAILLFGAGILATAFLLSDQLAARFAFLLDPAAAGPSVDTSVEGRLGSWAVAIELFVQHPLLGVGYGNYNPHFQSTALDLGLVFRGEARSAHGLYHETLAEGGLVGLSLLLAIFGAAILAPLRMAGALAREGQSAQAMELRGLAVGLLAMLIARVFLHDDFPVLMWTALAAGLAAPRIYRLPDRASTSS